MTLLAIITCSLKGLNSALPPHAQVSPLATLAGCLRDHRPLTIHAHSIEHLYVGGVIDLAEARRVPRIVRDVDAGLGLVVTNLHIRVDSHVLDYLATAAPISSTTPLPVIAID